MAIRILGHNVGEADVAQPGDVTTLRWEFNQILLVLEEAKAATEDTEATDAVIEEITNVEATVTNRAGDSVGNISDATGIEDGLGTNSVAFVRIHNLVDGERYKVKLVATITEDVKVATVIIFVPVVAP